MDAKFLVPYETARMLREKGYTEDADYYYDNQTREVKSVHQLREGYKVDFLHMLTTYYTTAPTYHEVLDWLTKRYIDIDTEYSSCTGMWSCRTQKWGTFFTEEYHTREDALNAAILETLKRI